ncbi:hypothetical protein PHYBLDRAFT_175651 [Phycomyces blakesleeanus NRRL 1555(-)]|uniref:Uncharacterized protein n=1 Tax=Phycomyces blakesleeanus (strain ATCC 8743b / DSM 1359 / FGSC 10004 / NBRC 33097 / NRRL 1555) TaxID=763407 RepID=A0A167JFW9_PHYB8|nr:hypothetical protein PHYBLDRAFT_175651 [Phycomyces blakesleeanus NRRL 1555(-)]OAD65909.1 hypothetical protein PHYBLDRAFT_175651 [Phycomyces blakesleeanus NRRL 1555(-)]|eukprot:XP_018283949.1 hypothetical protein PHYBLDRAFT_175651 [Phycomyces blakesleeanus NRRL 1555(-)]
MVMAMVMVIYQGQWNQLAQPIRIAAKQSKKLTKESKVNIIIIVLMVVKHRTNAAVCTLDQQNMKDEQRNKDNNNGSKDTSVWLAYCVQCVSSCVGGEGRIPFTYTYNTRLSKFELSNLTQQRRP